MRHGAQNVHATTNARRVRPEKVCSLYSMETSVRAPPGYARRQLGCAPRGRPRRLNADRRARTPTLMPGRSLTRPCPGTGTPGPYARTRAVGVPFATARAIPPASTLERRGCRPPASALERFYARCRRHNLAANAARLDNSRFALAQGIESAACSLSFAPGWHSLPHSSQTGQPPQTAECVGGPAETRERALRAPSRDSACRRWPDSFAGRCLYSTTRPAPQALRTLHSVPAHSISETGGEPLREHGAAPDSLRSQRQSGGACPRPHTPRNAARTMRRQTAPQSLR